ncbi:uncharacterized protein [Rutidosis leptorrhynchoides]|uniref:uncharacterized protein n=1 Tax=Rutidosis leptorrhynchoides TaxID=125765 RepID=UPI003A9A4430
MLIHQGDVLEDGTTLEDNNVAENSSIVIILSKTMAPSGETSTPAPKISVTSPPAAVTRALPPAVTEPASVPSATPITHHLHGFIDAYTCGKYGERRKSDCNQNLYVLFNLHLLWICGSQIDDEEYVVIGHVKKVMTQNQIKKFKETCFGPWLDLEYVGKD